MYPTLDTYSIRTYTDIVGTSSSINHSSEIMSVSPSKVAKAVGHDHDPATTAAANVLTTKNLDPQLFMAARRGDYTQLKELLKLNDGDWNEEQATAEHITGAAAEAQVIVEVDDHRRRPAAASELLDLVTMEGDSLLHVVAACGDDEKVLRCAKLLFSHYKDLLSARNSKGDTPLHCAATAGNNNMVKCLVLLARETDVSPRPTDVNPVVVSW
jgi:hypothetical protein